MVARAPWGLLTGDGRFVVAVPECDLPSVRATIGLEQDFFDAALHEVLTAHVLPTPRWCRRHLCCHACGC